MIFTATAAQRETIYTLSRKLKMDQFVVDARMVDFGAPDRAVGTDWIVWARGLSREKAQLIIKAMREAL